MNFRPSSVVENRPVLLNGSWYPARARTAIFEAAHRILESRRVLLMLFVAALLLQTVATTGALLFLKLPVSSGWDNEDYVRTADNVVAAHKFSVENAPPFRPNGFRTPGPLLLNIPLRLASLRNDVAATLISRLVLVVAALLCVKIATHMGIEKYALLAGALFVLTPSIFYYTMQCYATELPYAVACGALELGIVLYLVKAATTGAWLIGLSSLYALYLRPAALFMLMAVVGSCALGAVVTTRALRGRLFRAAALCLFGLAVAYGTWCYRNHVVFNDYGYSTVAGENLLKYNARAMAPDVDQQGREELNEALAKFPLKLQRYSGPDQFVLADQERSAGLRLIVRYPAAFMQSHFRGTLDSALIFRPDALKSRPAVVIVMSIAHVISLLLGCLGLVVLYRRLNVTQRAALLVIVVAGTVSVLTGGVLYSPRFRIPLDIALAVGAANCIAWTLSHAGTRLSAFRNAADIQAGQGY